MTNHPLKVYYPFYGKHFLCLWHTHDDGWQCLLSKTESGIFDIGKHCAKYYECKFDDILEIDIVAPSNALCEAATLLKRKEDIDDFCHTVSCTLISEKQLNKLPKQFTLCSTYKYAYDDLSHHDNEDNDAEHYNCANCINKVCLNGISKEDFYERYYYSWHEAFDDKATLRYNKKHDKTKYSLGEIAKDDEVLFVASARDFGHHSHGVVLKEVNASNVGTDAQLFYYRLLNQSKSTRLDELVVAKKEELKLAEKNRMAKHKLEDAKAKKLFEENLRKVFE